MDSHKLTQCWKGRRGEEKTEGQRKHLRGTGPQFALTPELLVRISMDVSHHRWKFLLPKLWESGDILFLQMLLLCGPHCLRTSGLVVKR